MPYDCRGFDGLIVIMANITPAPCYQQGLIFGRATGRYRACLAEGRIIYNMLLLFKGLGVVYDWEATRPAKTRQNWNEKSAGETDNTHKYP